MLKRDIAIACAAILAVFGMTGLIATHSSNTLQGVPEGTPVVYVAKAGPDAIYPNKALTPGVLNGLVRDDTVQKTICVSGWTATIRPPASYTTKLKIQQMKAQGLGGSPADYEEDHFISLELGGNPTSPENLWPEPYKPLGTLVGGAKQKDATENYLHKEVCAGRMSLSVAQGLITSDWYSVYKSDVAKASDQLGASPADFSDPDDE